MWSKEDIIKRQGNEVILIKKGKVDRYYKGKIDNTRFRIRHVQPISKDKLSLKSNTNIYI